jgi:hypothetical protein
VTIINVTSEILLKGRQAVMWHVADDKESNSLLSMFGAACYLSAPILTLMQTPLAMQQ